MKRKIRRSVFETNSSSTHSVSICHRGKLVHADIPKESVVVIDGKYATGTDIFDELGKLNFVVTILASIVERQCDYDELNIKSFDEMINLNWFKWLAEVIMEDSNTELVYKHPLDWQGKECTWVPYYDTTYDEHYSIEDIFTDDNDSVLTDKDLFKARVRDIIYNPEIIIEDKENEY